MLSTLTARPEALERLRQIQEETRKRDSKGVSRCGQYYRGITTAEWEEIKQLILDNELPCTLGEQPYGFSLFVFGHTDIPDASESDLENLLMVDWTQFSFLRAKCKTQDEILVALSELTHRTRNLELLSFYKIEIKSDPTDYSY